MEYRFLIMFFCGNCHFFFNFFVGICCQSLFANYCQYVSENCNFKYSKVQIPPLDQLMPDDGRVVLGYGVCLQKLMSKNVAFCQTHIKPKFFIIHLKKISLVLQLCILELKF